MTDPCHLEHKNLCLGQNSGKEGREGAEGTSQADPRVSWPKKEQHRAPHSYFSFMCGRVFVLGNTTNAT